MSNIHKEKTVRYFVLALALVFACSVFSFTAFAAGAELSTASNGSQEKTNSGISSTEVTSTPSISSSSSSTSTGGTTAKSGTTTKSSGTTTKTSSSKSSTAPKKSTLSGTFESQADATSENWKQVLSTADSSAVSGLVSSDVSSAAPAASTGGVSWLMIVGIILVVLGLSGIGFFIYIQFINKQDTLEDITAQAKRQVKHSQSSAPRPRRR